MLKVLNISSLKEKFSYLESFDPENQTWVVADLHSKSFLQGECLKRIQCLPEDAVLRVSELWRKTLHHSFVDIEVVSNQLISTLMGEWLKHRDIKWARHPGTPSLLMRYMGEFLPLLIDEDLTSKTREWLRENPNVLLRWGHWFELSVEAWAYFCEQKILAPNWVSAYLSGTTQWMDHAWNRNLIFDVGADLTGVEVELLRKVAEKQDVIVFSPDEEWCSKYPSTLLAYDMLAGRPYRHQAKINLEAVEHVVCQRYTTQIAEVKAAVSCVRKWLSEGVFTKKIGVLAADIESYWPALSSYMEYEGVPVAKDVVVTAATLPSVQLWISRLKIEAREIEAGHLENCVFSSAESAPIEFERFQQLFSKLYEERDIQRDQNIKNLFQFQFSKNDRLGRDQFFSWAVKFWAGEAHGLDKIASQWLLECPADTQLEIGSWLAYLSGLISKVEMKVRDALSDGVICASFDAAQAMEFEKVILLGLSESELRESLELSVNTTDVQKISQDLGVFLEAPDRSYNEYLAESIAARVSRSSGSPEIFYFFSATDFSGQSRAPSLLWLRQAMKDQVKIEEYHSPSPTRWDEMQNVSLPTMGLGDIEPYIHQDMGKEPLPAFRPPREIRYSPSQIEKYLKCPFVFTCEKVFHLSDLPDVDLDIDAMTSGRLLHAILDKLMEEPLRLQREHSEIENLVDSVRDDLALLIGDERLWPAKKSHFVRLAQKFLKFEQEWRVQYPATTTLARELRVDGELTIGPGKKIQVRGQIDRVDGRKAGDGSHESEYVVIDYKSSGSTLHNHGSWIKNNEIQLAFYSMALEEGLTDLPRAPVAGAFYFVLSSMNREKGVRLLKRGDGLFDVNARHRSVISEEGLMELLKNVRSKIADVVSRVESGNLGPKPQNIHDCPTCHWRTLCRAPHLN